MTADLCQQAKYYWTTNHNQNGRVVREGHEHRWELANYILDTYQPSNVFEFGCGAGRNLAVLNEVDGTGNLQLLGIDGNEISVERAQEVHADTKNLHVALGDEHTIDCMRDNAWDMVFTVSVLDHIPDPQWRAVYDNLKRIACKAVVLLEPVQWMYADYGRDGYDGNSMLEHDYSLDQDLATTNFTWAHDYFGHDSGIRVVRSMPIHLGGNWQRFGDLYTLMECRL